MRKLFLSLAAGFVIVSAAAAQTTEFKLAAGGGLRFDGLFALPSMQGAGNRSDSDGADVRAGVYAYIDASYVDLTASYSLGTRFSFTEDNEKYAALKFAEGSQRVLSFGFNLKYPYDFIGGRQGPFIGLEWDVYDKMGDVYKVLLPDLTELYLKGGWCMYKSVNDKSYARVDLLGVVKIQGSKYEEDWGVKLSAFGVQLCISIGYWVI
jgi:hypothetical protein